MYNCNLERWTEDKTIIIVDGDGKSLIADILGAGYTYKIMESIEEILEFEEDFNLWIEKIYTTTFNPNHLFFIVDDAISWDEEIPWD